MDYKQINKFVKVIQKHESINVMVKNITSDTILYNYQENNVFVSASIIKVPIMLAILNYVLNSDIKLDSYINIDKDDILSDKD